MSEDICHWWWNVATTKKKNEKDLTKPTWFCNYFSRLTINKKKGNLKCNCFNDVEPNILIATVVVVLDFEVPYSICL